MSTSVRAVRIRSALVLLVVVAALLLSGGVASAQRPLTPLHPLAPSTGRIQAGLVARARAQGSVRVIVNFRTRVPAQGFRTRAARNAFAKTLKTRANTFATVARSTGGTFVRRYSYLPSVVMDATPRTIERLRARSDVASVAEDRLYRVEANWNVPLVQGNLMSNAGFGGTGQIVAVLDTGVDATHPLLAGKVRTDLAACFASGADADGATPGSVDVAGDCPNDKQVQYGDSAAAPCTWAPDECLHGTHVAGIAAGRYIADGPAGTSISGVARHASVLPVQVFSDFLDTDGRTHIIGAWDSDMAAGLDYVYQLASTGTRIAAVNLSVGGGSIYHTCDSDPGEQPFLAAVNLLRTRGIATVVAAGNDGLTGGTSYPGCLSAVITVASTTRSDQFSWFSNIASWVDVAAPGSGIWSSVPGGRYMKLDGTSMATPHVAGAWAELRSRFPNASFNALRLALRRTGVRVKWGPISTHRIKVMDAGDWLGATSVSLTRSSGARVSSGSNVSFHVTVTRLQSAGSDPTGKVSLKVAGLKVTSVTLDPLTGSSTTALATIKAKVTGKHGAKVSVQAFYTGDGRFVASHSPVVKVTIK